jgi:hypothetical protein
LGLAGLGLVFVSKPAEAQDRTRGLIKDPNAHPQYTTELEPHLVLDVFGDDHVGLGGRATFEIVDPGFVPTINNTVGIGVGADWVHRTDLCHAGICHNYDQLYIPLVMQWNFWFTKQWSAFGEPGLAIRFHDHGDHDDDTDLEPVFGIGGRLSFTEKAALTLRLGVPEISLGVSFFL